MRVKSVTEEVHDQDYGKVRGRYVIRFEHNGAEWEKFLQMSFDSLTLKSLLNSVIGDTLVKTR